MKSCVLCFLVLGFIASPAQSAEDAFRYGVQTSLNRYRVDDPAGKTANGSGVSYGLIAFYETNRSGRFMFNVNKDAYELAASTNEIGQNVTSMGGSVSYQRMWRLARDFKPWFGAGLGYTAAHYRNRHTITPSGLFSVPLANRDATETSFLLNGAVDWRLNQDFDIGLQAQFNQAISSNSNSFRVGIYVVYK